jgi:hypothetical protein
VNVSISGKCDRATRVAGNRRALQTFFGAQHSVGHVAFVRSTAWICECANPTCSGVVEASVQEYEAIHGDDAFLFVVPSDGHYMPEIEQVVEHRDRYWIVEQIEARSERTDGRPIDTPLSLRT